MLSATVLLGTFRFKIRMQGPTVGKKTAFGHLLQNKSLADYKKYYILVAPLFEEPYPCLAYDSHEMSSLFFL